MRENPKFAIFHSADQLLLVWLSGIFFLFFVIWILTQIDYHTSISAENHSPQIIQIDQASPSAQHVLIDINQADFHDLILLPGIGEKTAQKIIAERDTHGHFSSLEDIKRVHGIGEKKLEAIRPFLLPIPEIQMADGKDRRGEPRKF
ncbi:MAG: helix-hairpin-helix domain-containing protein [Planctomycetia bacterium]|nr:helix-hairpin-helix domain-containing protein [Planctomycetia bacterium]